MHGQSGLPVAGTSCSFKTTVTFIRLMSLFVTDVAGSLEAHVLAFLDLAFVPLGSLLLL